ncbi:ATP-binding cassette domain-containing protein, partial [Siminovitchia sp. 179-K 8D1 HS]|uniref:ATP-binding cassette domain-containing protein n=1 Tax=Siminovitchia sp. 179-K 8D1 HS TaxID=3142385 RepID=UPI0039A2A9B2
MQEFTVAENIFLGREPKWYGTSIVNQAVLNKNADQLLKKLNINLNPKTRVVELSVSDQQMVVIAKSLSQNAKILILDEPTARLGHHEIEQLLEYIIHLKKHGMTIIYISHHFDELFKISDEITVLRDGKSVATKNTCDVTKDELIKMMVNREFSDFLNKDHKTERSIGPELLKVQGLSKKGVVNNVSFTVREGEILGISGLVGAGRTEMIRTLLGVDKKDSGTVILEGKEMNFKSLRDSIKSGLVLVPEERRKQGIVGDLSVQANISLGSLETYSKGPIINQNKEKQGVKDLINRLHVRRSCRFRGTISRMKMDQRRSIFLRL